MLQDAARKARATAESAESSHDEDVDDVDPERDDEMAATDAPNAALPSAPARGSASAVLCTEIVMDLQLSHDRVSATSRPTFS